MEERRGRRGKGRVVMEGKEREERQREVERNEDRRGEEEGERKEQETYTNERE